MDEEEKMTEKKRRKEIQKILVNRTEKSEEKRKGERSRRGGNKILTFVDARVGRTAETPSVRADFNRFGSMIGSRNRGNRVRRSRKEG
jgi:hypothetical protein